MPSEKSLPRTYLQAPPINVPHCAMPYADPAAKRERERLRKALKTIAKGRMPGVVGRPGKVTDATAAAAEAAVHTIMQELVPTAPDDTEEGLHAFTEALARLIDAHEPMENSEAYRECVYRNLEDDSQPLDGEPIVDAASGDEAGAGRSNVGGQMALLHRHPSPRAVTLDAWMAAFGAIGALQDMAAPQLAGSMFCIDAAQLVIVTAAHVWNDILGRSTALDPRGHGVAIGFRPLETERAARGDIDWVGRAFLCVAPGVLAPPSATFLTRLHMVSRNGLPVVPHRPCSRLVGGLPCRASPVSC